MRPVRNQTRRLPVVATLIAVLGLLGAPEAAAQATAEPERPTPEVAAQELVELTTALTPFTVVYDRAAKKLMYTEVVESGNPALDKRTGRLEVRLDRLDPKRINYQTDKSPGPLLIKGRTIAGQMHFFCNADQRCIRRGFPDASGNLNAEESNESTFTLDVYAGNILNDLRLYAGMVQVLIAATAAD
ncbi:MAG: hypothetical protein EXQ95_11610 [Alphaproteobacteria bacterium]|nr:hypothetical protein [Alphaproteobacteria bacterium]